MTMAPVRALLLGASIFALAACGGDSTQEIPRGQAAEALSTAMNGGGALIGTWGRDKDAFERARAERRQEGIPGGVISNRDVGAALAVNGVRNGLLQVSATENAPFFMFELTDRGWDWAEKAVDDEVFALDVRITQMRNRECYDQDTPRARICAADIQFALGVSSHFRDLAGNPERLSYSARAMFVRTPETGEWAFTEFTRDPEPRNDDTPAWNLWGQRIQENIWAAVPENARSAVVEDIEPLLQTRFEADRTAELANDRDRVTFSAAAGGRLPLVYDNDTSRRFELAQPILRGASAWDAMNACWNLTHGGESDWRLVRAYELGALLRPATIYDHADAFDRWTAQYSISLTLPEPTSAAPAQDVTGGLSAPAYDMGSDEPYQSPGYFMTPDAANFFGAQAVAFTPTGNANRYVYATVVGKLDDNTFGDLLSPPDLAAAGPTAVQTLGYGSIRADGSFEEDFNGRAFTEQVVQALPEGGQYRAICIREVRAQAPAPLAAEPAAPTAPADAAGAARRAVEGAAVNAARGVTGAPLPPPQ